MTWFSTPQASRALGVNPTTLYRWIDQGRIPAYRFGKLIKVRPADLETFIEGARK